MTYLSRALRHRAASSARLPLSCRRTSSSRTRRSTLGVVGSRRAARSKSSHARGASSSRVSAISSGVELEPGGAGVVRLDPGLFLEKLGEATPVAVSRCMAHEPISDRADTGIQLERALEGPQRGVEAPELSLEHLGALHVEPRREVGLRRIGIGHASEMGRERVPVAAPTPCS